MKSILIIATYRIYFSNKINDLNRLQATLQHPHIIVLYIGPNSKAIGLALIIIFKVAEVLLEAK